MTNYHYPPLTTDIEMMNLFNIPPQETFGWRCKYSIKAICTALRVKYEPFRKDFQTHRDELLAHGLIIEEPVWVSLGLKDFAEFHELYKDYEAYNQYVQHLSTRDEWLKSSNSPQYHYTNRLNERAKPPPINTKWHRKNRINVPDWEAYDKLCENDQPKYNFY